MTRRGQNNITVRIDPDLWERFGTATPDRSAAIRDFVRWFAREPGARMPKRPDRTTDGDQDQESPHSGA
jgi:hypothetical protein